MLSVEVVIDLHASDVDQLPPLTPRGIEHSKRFLRRDRVIRLALDVHRIGVETSLPPRFGEADGVEDALGNAVFGSCGLDLPFAGTARGECVRGKAGRCEYRQDRQKQPFQ